MHHNVYVKARRLDDTLESCTVDLICQYKALDWDIRKACLAAKKALGQQQISPWSPQLLQRLSLQFYWSKLKSICRTKKSLSPKLKLLGSELG